MSESALVLTSGRAGERAQGERSRAAEMAKEQGPSLVPVPADTPKVQSAVPWYESTALWGALGAAVAIVLVVVAAMVKDLRWLLIVAWPFFCLAGWAALRGVKRSIIKWPSIGFTSCLIG